jgi:hypothetical protein
MGLKQVEKDKGCLQKKILETCDDIKIVNEKAKKAIKVQSSLKLRINELERYIEETVWRSEKIAYYVHVLLNSSSNSNTSYTKPLGSYPQEQQQEQQLDPLSISNNNAQESSKTSSSTSFSSSSSSSFTSPDSLCPDKCSVFVQELETEFLAEHNGEASKKYDLPSADSDLLSLENAENFDIDSDISPKESNDSDSNLSNSPKRINQNGHINSQSSNVSILNTTSQSDIKNNTKLEKKKSNSKGLSAVGSLLRGITNHLTRTEKVSGLAISIGDERERQKALMSRIHFFSSQSSKCQVTYKITLHYFYVYVFI